MVQLTLSKTEIFALIDDEDLEKILSISKKWFLHKQRGYIFATPWDKNLKKCITVELHNFIMQTPKGFYTDHINKNKLDNRKKNLRIVTPQQNAYNRQKNKIKHSKYIGVTKTVNGKWQAKITKNGRMFHLGVFDTEIDAAKAYDQKCIELRGEYASLNIL